MTAVSQNFTVYQGTNAAPIFTVRDKNGALIDLSSVQEIAWTVQRDLSSGVVLTKLKSTGGITFPGGGTDGQFKVNISPADLVGLSLYYIHQAIITDVTGGLTPVALGRVQVGRGPLATYSGDPSSSTRDAVRLWLSDTDMSSPKLLDGEIDYLLGIYPNPMLAAAQGARSLAAKWSGKASKRVEGLSISYGELAGNYLTLAADLEARASTMDVIPYAGGTSVSDMQNVNANTDRPRPAFSRDQFDDDSPYPANTSEWPVQ